MTGDHLLLAVGDELSSIYLLSPTDCWPPLRPTVKPYKSALQRTCYGAVHASCLLVNNLRGK